MANDPYSADEESGGGFDPLSLVRIFWRRKMLFFVPFALCLAMAGVAIKTMTPIYESSSQIAIKFEGLNSNLLTDPSRRFGRARNIDAMAFHQMDMLYTSPEFLEMMVREMHAGGSGDAAPLTDAEVERLQGRLASQLSLKQDGARLFEFAVRDPSPAAAYRVASYVLPRFVAEYRLSQLAAGNSTKDFLQGQLKRYQTNRETAELALKEYMTELASDALTDNPITSLNLSIAQTNLATAQERYQGPDATEGAELGQRMRRILGTVPDVESYRGDGIVQSTTGEMETVGLELQMYEVGLAKRRDLEARLGQLRVRINTRIEEMVAVTYPGLSPSDRNQISHFVYFAIFRSGARLVLDRLAAYIQEFREFSVRQPEQSTRLAELRDNVMGARSLVGKIETEITQQTMNLEASRSELGMQIRVRRKPRLSTVPVEPDKVKLTLLGVLLSVGIGLGLVMLAIFLDRSFNSVADIEKVLGLEVIGTLPAIKDIHFERRRKVRVLRWATIILGIFAVGAVGFLVVYPRLG